METQQHQEGGARAEDSTRQGSFERNEDVETTMPTEHNQDMITMVDMTSEAMSRTGLAEARIQFTLDSTGLSSSNYETVAAASGMETQQHDHKGIAGVEASTRQGCFERSRVETAIPLEDNQDMNPLVGTTETLVQESVEQEEMNYVQVDPEVMKSSCEPRLRMAIERIEMAKEKGSLNNKTQDMNPLVGTTETVWPSQLRMASERMKMAGDQRLVVIEKGPLNNKTPAGQAKSPTTVVIGAQGHGNKKNILGDVSSWENEDELFHQKTHLGSTALHIASKYGKDDWVERITAKQDSNLLTAKNDNGDTPLHVAARDGRVSTLKLLLAANLRNLPRYSEDPKAALDEMLARNKQGNTFFHEAIFNEDQGAIELLLSDKAQFEGGGNNGISELIELAALTCKNNEEKSVLYMAIEAGYNQVIVDQIMVKLLSESPALDKLIEKHHELKRYVPHGRDHVPAGKSPIFAAIIKKDIDILEAILERKPEWIHLRDVEGRIPLHYAASVGYLRGAQYLLKICSSCANHRDNSGFLPLHLASYEGHVEVVQELLDLELCPYPRETLDYSGRNILHIAAQSGKFNMVKYILRTIDDEAVREMINDKDVYGNTPLHLASMCSHPKIVHALTWDTRVNFTLVNEKKGTALDACGQNSSSLRQLLTWIALKSAGVPYADGLSCSIKDPPKSVETLQEQNDPDMDPFKDEINTLIVVSTLIITAAFAAGFTVPGSGDSSDILNRVWYKIFIFCTTISMYGSLGVTLILIWACLENIHLALSAVKVAKPLLGVTIAALSVAFLAGVHLVISHLSWLATTILVISMICTLMLLLLYIHLWLPSARRNILVRYISYYPFLIAASLVDCE